ncbi:poly(ADP-ribose) glycohydrolase isoform X1 [Anguilla rostrata]|uniref:poly(ADP-ribose) glycohydrolase isoform X1 n=2 Tax=Anguilla rostrata TaxID=7938 RepID=UPI0030CE0E7D
MEHRSEVTADHDSENDGQLFDEKMSCSSCKLQRAKDNEEMKRLKLENKQLKDELAQYQGMTSSGCPNACPIQAPNGNNSMDGLLGERWCGQNEETGAMKGSSEMSKKNDSTQMKSVLFPDSTSPGCKQEDLIKFGDETQCKPSASGAASDCKRPEADPKALAGGYDDFKYGESCPLSELKTEPRCHMQLDKLSFSASHTVLVDVVRFYKDGSLIPKAGRNVWDNLSVKMPYAEECTLTKHGILLQAKKQSRWEDIEKYLQRLVKTSSLTTADVEKTIKKYNPKYKDEWSFDALHRFFESIPPKEKETYTRTLRRMAELALKLPRNCQKNVPLLRHGQNHSITVSQMQIACLLANAFYCTFPHRNATHPGAEYANYPTINFHSLFGRWSERKMQKFKAIFNYFEVMTGEERQVPRGLVTFTRRYIPDHEFPRWRSRNDTLTKLHISSKGTIEKDGQGMLQVDFACSMVGGGVLASGLVQEEILFLINPELIVARLFTEKLGDTECLKITGSQRYSDYFGYSDDFTCLGHHKDETSRDEWWRRYRQIVAIDALNFKNPREQFNMKKVTRELNKAYCGFMGETNTHPDYYPAIATGNWGCGAFGGDPRLKALIQMMAAAVTRRDMAYFTFDDSHLELDLRKIHHFLTTHKVTVGRLYNTLENFCSALYSNEAKTSDLYSFIMKSVKETTSRH